MEISKNYICEILVTSDLHGHIQPIDYRTRTERHTGLGKIATVIRNLRQETPELLLLDNGDLLQGTPLSYYAATVGKAEINPAIKVLNELQYDAAVIGNHEFNYGRDLLEKAAADSGFPWLSAGILNEETEEPAFGKPYIVQTLSNGVRIAILGVTTHYIPNWENPAHIKGLIFQDALETVKQWVPRIREQEQPDLLVVAYHGGFEREWNSGEPSGPITGENQAYAMCTDVEGIDVLITGHQHRMLAGELGGVVIVQPGFNGQAIGRVRVELEHTTGKWSVLSKQAQLIEINEKISADPIVLGLVQEIEEETQLWLDQPIGEVTGDMTVTNPLHLRCKDHAFIEFINKVQMDAAGVDLSAASLLHEESVGFAGKVTMRDILTQFIYPNTLTVLRISGLDIRAALEQTAAYFQLGPDGTIEVNPVYLRPKPQHYNYDMWEGIEYELDVSKPIGQRLTKLLRAGLPIRDAESYDVVMNNYRAAGGGDYAMYQGKPIVREVQVEMSELVAAYLSRHPTVAATCNNNWRVIGGRSEG